MPEKDERRTLAAIEADLEALRTKIEQDFLERVPLAEMMTLAQQRKFSALTEEFKKAMEAPHG